MWYVRVLIRGGKSALMYHKISPRMQWHKAPSLHCLFILFVVCGAVLSTLHKLSHKPSHRHSSTALQRLRAWARMNMAAVANMQQYGPVQVDGRVTSRYVPNTGLGCTCMVTRYLLEL